MLGASLDIHIMPHRLVLQQVGPWPRRRLGARTELEVKRGAGSESGWAASLQACAEALNKFRDEKALTVVFSDLWARFSLITLGDFPIDDAEKSMLARAHFDRDHPETRSDPWPIRIAQQGDRLLVSAVDPGLLRALNEMSSTAGKQLASAEPHFSRTFDRAAQSLANFDGWMLVDEPATLLLARVAKGHLTSIHSQRVGPSESIDDAVANLLNRQGVVLGHSVGSVFICSYAERHIQLREPWQRAGQASGSYRKSFDTVTPA